MPDGLSYHCIDRWNDKDDFEAIIWEGNFWDENVHDYAEIPFSSCEVVVKKICNVLAKYTDEKSTVLVLLPNLVQLPLSIMALDRLSLSVVLMNPCDNDLEEKLLDILIKTRCDVIITVDAVFQGSRLVAVKSILDDCLEKTSMEVNKVLVLRHCSPNEGIPPPQKQLVARRPCYDLQFSLKEGRDVEWSREIAAASKDNWSRNDRQVDDGISVLLPIWKPNHELELLRLNNRQISQQIECLSGYFSNCQKPVLLLGHPSSSIFYLSCLLSSFYYGKTLVQFEGLIDYPDPSRLLQIINKYEVEMLILDSAMEDVPEEYSLCYPVDSLKKVLVPSCSSITTFLDRDVVVVEQL